MIGAGFHLASGARVRGAGAGRWLLTRGAFCSILRSSGGVWRRLVARGVWDAEVGGSSPLTPTGATPAGVAQLAELLPSKQVVARSNRVARSPQQVVSPNS